MAEQYLKQQKGAIELKILITGASGLIGGKLAEILSNKSDDKENEIFAVFRDNKKIVNLENVNWIFHDFSSGKNLDDFPNQIDSIIHLAQSENFKDFPNSANDIFRINVNSTQLLLDFARKNNVKTFIYASSGGVYGSGSVPFDESQKIFLNPQLGFYITSKVCSELITQNYSSFFNTIIFRFFFVYGPGQKKFMLIPRLVDSILEGKPVMLQGNEGIRINPTYVDDAANAIADSLRLNMSQIVNVAGPDVISLKQIGKTIGELTGKDPIFDIQENLAPNDIIADINKMTKLLFKPKISFKDGINRYINSIQ